MKYLVLLTVVILTSSLSYGQAKPHHSEEERQRILQQVATTEISDLFFEPSPEEKRQLEEQRHQEQANFDARMVEAYRSHAKINAQSCESIYYGLFADTLTAKHQFIGDRKNFDDRYDVSSKEFDALADKDGNVTRELLNHANDILGGVRGLYYKILTQDPHYKNELALDQEYDQRLKSTVVDVETQYGYGAFMNPQQECDPNLYAHACRNAKKVGLTNTGKAIYSSPAKEQSVLGIGSLKLLRAQSYAAVAWTMGHESTHLTKAAPKSLVACLARPESMGIRLTQKINSLGKHGEQMTQGAGTSTTKEIDQFIRAGDLKGAQEYLRVLKKSGDLEDQEIEAVADYVGTKVATQFIKTYYKPEQRRNAALAILFSWKPLLYTPEEESLINQAGSKMTNERRVLRGMLAQKEFRDLIGCQFEKETPVDCTQDGNTTGGSSLAVRKLVEK